ncbi:GNAT family N-acetyltransferase [Actinoplanes sp. NPDC026619]|uniref:GNAT family N-acetyltransferase n=1 Tax=Actinoplanes sp. NPDC026619 TaxID=3155798 RepID=UPI0033EC6DD7
MPVELRPATGNDAAAIATIWESGWRDGHLGHVPDELAALRTADTFRVRAAEHVADTTVAEIGGEVAGFVMVVGDEVEQVYVAAGHRGSGVSGALLAEAERLVAGSGHPVAWLAVVPGNARARRFYERNGWTDDGGFNYQAAHAGGIVDVPCRRYVKQLADQASGCVPAAAISLFRWTGANPAGRPGLSPGPAVFNGVSTSSRRRDRPCRCGRRSSPWSACWWSS